MQSSVSNFTPYLLTNKQVPDSTKPDSSKLILFLRDKFEVDKYINKICQYMDKATDRPNIAKEGFIDIKEQVFIECIFSTLNKIPNGELYRLMPMARLQSIINSAQENDPEIINSKIRGENLARIILAVHDYRQEKVTYTNSFMPNLSLQELVLFKAILQNTSIVKKETYYKYTIIPSIDKQIEKLSLSGKILPKAGNSVQLVQPNHDIKNPNATLKTISYIYKGGIDRNNLPHGIGAMVFPNGDRLNGRFVNGELKSGSIYWHGASHYYVSSGAEFKFGDSCVCGEFIDNQINGKGKYYWEDGQSYEGDIVNGIPRSQTEGTFNWKNPEGEICKFAGIFNTKEILIDTKQAISPAKCNFTGEICATGKFTKGFNTIEDKTLKLSFSNGKIVHIELNINKNDPTVPLSANDVD